MAVSIGQLQEAGRTIPVAYGDVSVSVTYRLKAIGKATSDWLEEHKNEDDSQYGLIALLVKSWDLVDNEGQPLPVSVETAKQIPELMLVNIVKGVLSDAGLDIKGAESGKA